MNLFGYGYGYDIGYSLKELKQMMLEQSDGKKRKGMNKRPHKNNYKQKLKKNRK